LKFDPLGLADHPSCPAGHCRPSAQMSTKTGALHSRSRLWEAPRGAQAGLASSDVSSDTA
jgi:hypothetical protein